jgi:predicted dehydrogenase
MMPVIEAGKDVFVEWPLASNLAQATEMYTTAQKSGSKTIVGLQGRSSPSIRKMKELVAKGTVGELLSSTLEFTLDQPGDVEPPATEYFSKKESGGNFFTILFAHVADSVIHTLGGLEEVSTLLTTRWPETKLLKADGTFDRMVKRETPDHVMVQGTLKNNGAPISMVARNGKGFKDSPNLVWRILGTKGQIRMTSAVLLNLGLGGEKIEVFDHEKDAVEVVDAHDAEEVKDLTPFAKNIGMLYEGYVKGWGVEDGFVGFEQALGMHTIIDRMENSSEGRKYEKITL